MCTTVPGEKFCLLVRAKINSIPFHPRSFTCSLARPPETVHVKKFTKLLENAIVPSVLQQIFIRKFLIVAILFDLSATKMSNSKLNVFERVLAFVLCKHVITFEFIFCLLMMRGEGEGKRREGDSGEG